LSLGISIITTSLIFPDKRGADPAKVEFFQISSELTDCRKAPSLITKGTVGRTEHRAAPIVISIAALSPSGQKGSCPTITLQLASMLTDSREGSKIKTSRESRYTQEHESISNNDECWKHNSERLLNCK
jgi:hypothetical protein